MNVLWLVEYQATTSGSKHHKMSNENCSQHENWGNVWGTGKGRPRMQAVDIVLCSYTVP